MLHSMLQRTEQEKLSQLGESSVGAVNIQLYGWSTSGWLLVIHEYIYIFSFGNPMHFKYLQGLEVL